MIRLFSALILFWADRADPANLLKVIQPDPVLSYFILPILIFHRLRTTLLKLTIFVIQLLS